MLKPDNLVFDGKIQQLIKENEFLLCYWQLRQEHNTVGLGAKQKKTISESKCQYEGEPVEPDNKSFLKIRKCDCIGHFKTYVYIPKGRCIFTEASSYI